MEGNWDVMEVDSDLPADQVKALLAEIVGPPKSTIRLTVSRLH
jgi:hypothetical protein